MELEPIVRRSARLLAAVHELHKQGYQDLAVYCGMSSSGYYWRCSLIPFSQILYTEGELKIFKNAETEEVNHSSGEFGNDYFGWSDAKHDNARQLSEKIKHRFPMLSAKTKRSNYEYAGWFTLMLGSAERGHLPVMYRDYLVLGDLNALPTTSDEYIPRPPHEKLLKFGNKKFAYSKAPHLQKNDDWHFAYTRIIENWRSSEIAYLPKYPTETNDIYEIGAYWEGAIFYIQKILGYRRIDAFLKSLKDIDSQSERWFTFLMVWNCQGQLEFLKTFLIRSMLEDSERYPLQPEERADYEHWLCRFEEIYRPILELNPSLSSHNPYFGGNNPLHLGMILQGLGNDRLLRSQ